MDDGDGTGGGTNEPASGVSFIDFYFVWERFSCELLAWRRSSAALP
jgi:hypothetical protein